MDKTFETTEPVTVDLKVSHGDFTLTADPGCTTARVELHGDEDYVTRCRIELLDGVLSVRAPEHEGRNGSVQLSIWGVRIGRGPRIEGRVLVPADSSLRADLQAADLHGEGSWESVEIHSGSGDVTWAHCRDFAAMAGSGEITCDSVAGDARVQTGSGDVTLGGIGGALAVTTGSGEVTLRDTICGDVVAKTGSGDIRVREIQGQVALQTASGDVTIEHVGGEAVLRTASGDIAARRLDANVQATSASGDLDLSRIGPGDCVARSVSGDVRIVVPPHVPIWTDVHTASGDLSNRLEPVGEPEPGEPVIRLRVTTASGDIQLATARA